MIPRVRDGVLDFFCEPYQRAFGGDSQLSKSLSRTRLFGFYFAAISFLLFASGIWVATSGDTRMPVYSTIASSVVLGIGMSVVWFYSTCHTETKPTLKFIGVASVYVIFAYAGRWAILGEGELPFFGLSLIQGGLLGLLLAVFSRPMLPENLVKVNPSNHKNRREALTLHLDNQWRIGQIALTMTVLTVGGLLVWIFPHGGSALGRKRLMYTALPFVFTLGPVLLYVLRKVFLIEQEVAKTFADG